MTRQRDTTRRQLEDWSLGYPALDPDAMDAVFIDGVHALELHHLARWAGAEAAYQIFCFGARIAVQPWTDQHEQALRQRFDFILAEIAQRISRLPDFENEILGFSYDQLHRQEMTRAGAARWASRMLGRELTTEAWRKAVDRWAVKHGKPKVELPSGRPKTKNMDK